MPIKAITGILAGVLLLYAPVSAQVIPEPGAQLNYTQIMFEHPQVTGAGQYMLEVTVETDTGFKHPMVKQKDSSTAFMASGLEFGKKYVWRYAAIYSGKQPDWNGPYGFEILNDKAVDKNLFRVRVVENDVKLSSGGLIAIDAARNIVDRKGNCVWFLPADTAERTGVNRFTPAINDMRVTPAGTITLLNGANAEEIDLNARILWQAPPCTGGSGKSNINAPLLGYNHCFKKLQSGNYMVIGWENNYIPSPVINGANINAGTSGAKTMVTHETLKEFDRNGNLVWDWGSEKYISEDELRKLVISVPEAGVLNTTPGGHLNAFDVDEKNGFVYASFRNLSRVIKIDKKTCEVVYAWGPGTEYGGVKNSDGPFLKQHETKLLKDGSVAVFSNGILHNGPIGAAVGIAPGNGNPPKGMPVGVMPGPGGGAGPFSEADIRDLSDPSSVVIFNEPPDTLHSQLVWKFDCRMDPVRNKSARGGSIDEMKNGNLLICMGTINRVFEVTRSKKVVWSALVEKRTDTTWGPMLLYKTGYCSSLYPCYFTVQTSTDTIKNTTGAFMLRIFNDGTEDDSYRVSISSASGSYQKQLLTDVLNSGKSTRIEIKPQMPPAGNERVAVTVLSITNPDFKRTVYVQCSR